MLVMVYVQMGTSLTHNAVTGTSFNNGDICCLGLNWEPPGAGLVSHHPPALALQTSLLRKSVHCSPVFQDIRAGLQRAGPQREEQRISIFFHFLLKK